MKIVVAPSAPASGPSPDFQQLRDGLRILQDELQSWRDASRQELEQRLALLREELKPVATDATDNVLKGLDTLSQRVQSLEKEEPLTAEKLAREVQALCRRELLALDEKLGQQINSYIAFEKKAQDQASLIEKRLREQEQAVEKLRVSMTTVKPIEPVRPVESVAPVKPVEPPAKPAEPEAVLEPAKPVLPDMATPPSLFARFWRYMNAPAIEIKK